MVPLLQRLREYQRPWLQSDLVAGVTVFSVLVPSALAYGDLAGVAPEVGLYAAVAAMLVYAVLGTLRQLVVGPDASSALLTATVVVPLAMGSARAATWRWPTRSR